MKTAGPLRAISSMATRQLLAALLDQYVQRSRVPVELVAIGGVDAARRVRAGEPFDFVVLAADAIDGLSASGHVDATTRTALVRSNIAVAVASGARPPEISSEAAVREALLAAPSIGYSTGPSGTHLLRLFDRWGIADRVAPRLVQASPGVPVASLVADGNAAIGVQQLSELAGAPGIDVVGPLPQPIQATTVFTAAVCTTSTAAGAARDCIAFLASEATAETKRRFGLVPP